jgi:GTP-binding protein HflX
VALILDIFARRARTHEGRLQVELAQHQYLLPRLAGQWSHLERLGGGIGTRGPGESQLETDRRLIKRKIQRLEEQNEEIRRRRAQYRQQRQKSGIPVAALVGYTNAGKSTLLNALCKADAYADDRLFATLDPTTRRLTLPDNKTVLVTDTVGFIRKLPHELVTAFRATLEELAEADVLLHVVDASQPALDDHLAAVESLLEELGVGDRPTILVLNKMDRVETERSLDTLIASRPRVVGVSAATGKGMESLLAAIESALRPAPAVTAGTPQQLTATGRQGQG